MNARKLILTITAIATFAAPAAHAAGPDATTVIHYLAPKAGKYQIEIVNTSEIGYIDTLNWVPPDGLAVTAVTSTKGGSCRLANDVIACIGGKHKHGIAPPSCTCRPGGAMTVTFTATGYSPKFNGRYWTYYGIGSDTEITSMTPVPYHIPSYQANSGDLPVCALGTQPNHDNPTCVVE